MVLLTLLLHLSFAPADNIPVEEKYFRLFIESEYDSIAACQSSLEASNPLTEFYRTQTLFNNDSSVFLQSWRRSFAVAEKAGCDECVALHYLSVGLAHRKWQQFSVAVTNFKKGIAALQEKKVNHHQEILAALNAGLSNTYHQLGEFSPALQYGLDALRIAESLNDNVLKSQVYTPLSTIYADLSSPNNKLGTEQDRERYKSLAKRYMLLSYQTSLQRNNQRSSGTSAYNLGIFYNDENLIDSSNWFLRKAISHGLKSSNNELLSSAYNIMAINYSDTRIDSSLVFVDKSIEYAKDANLVRHQASAMLSKANLLAMSGRLNDAVKQAEQALEMCLLSERKVSIMNAYKILSELNEENGNIAKAYQYYQKHIAIRDSVVSENNYAEIEELKTKYDVELKDKEINSLSQQASIQSLELRQRNVLIGSLAGFIVLGGIVVLLFIRQKDLKQKQAIMEAEQRLNRARMNPHFFFNALASLQKYALNNDGITMASRLSQFGEVMRRTLESTYQEYVTLEEEVEFLDRYLSIQKDRNATFDYRIDVDATIDTGMLIPPMIIQPFIENSIEHGFAGLQRKGSIVVRFSEAGDELQIDLTDNGHGIAPGTPATDHISRATQIIVDRLYLLNAKVNSNARFNMQKNPDGEGVQVSIFLPRLFA